MRTAYSLGNLLKPRIQAELSAAALCSNFQVLSRQACGQGLLPMIKARAYGHGAEWAARQFLKLPQLYGVGVATLHEGGELRKALGNQGRNLKIIVFSGCVPWNEEKGRYCQKHRLTPMLASDLDWPLFVREKWPEKLSYQIKFNTGMNRLGMSLGMSQVILRSLRGKSLKWYPEGICSHLAMGEDPAMHLSQLQRERFQMLRSEFSVLGPSTRFHLANSSAIWNFKKWKLDDLTNVVRPGLALYGIPPWSGADRRGLTPVMTVKASVAQVQSIKKLESVGYGGTYVAKSATRVAILSAGYADGVHRMLSNQGKVWLGGRMRAILGTVSMDLSAVACGPGTQPGQWAELLGSNIDAWEQAKAAGTVPYELLTSLSDRVERIYG